jgi:UDP-N-acetylglucosamine 2-epimerase (non-hydrolysing)
VKLDFVIGTRPEVTKTGAIVAALGGVSGTRVRVLLTGQHTDLVIQAMNDLGFDEADTQWLCESREGLPLPSWRVDARSSLVSTWTRRPPDAVLVQGDTASALLGATVATQMGFKVCHLEAGLRLPDGPSIEPEEVNRREITRLANIHFVPSAAEARNLEAETVDCDQIAVIGDLSELALRVVGSRLQQERGALAPFEKRLHSALAEFDIGVEEPIALATFHRPSTLANANALAEWLDYIGNASLPVRIALCTRPDTRWEPFAKAVASNASVVLLPPLPPTVFHLLLRHASCIVTDSAGVQQEATLLRKPLVVTRPHVERYADYDRLTLVPPPFEVDLRLPTTEGTPEGGTIALSDWHGRANEIANLILTHLADPIRTRACS